MLREPPSTLADSFLVYWGLLCCYVSSCFEQMFHLVGTYTDCSILFLWSLSHAQEMSVSLRLQVKLKVPRHRSCQNLLAVFFL